MVRREEKRNLLNYTRWCRIRLADYPRLRISVNEADADRLQTDRRTSAQNIRVDVPTTITVAISTDAEVMQNAAERMLGLTMDDKQNLITDVVYGQMRLVIADMTIEELDSDRDKFLSKVKDNNRHGTPQIRFVI